ncbi:MAG: DUF234 domain-containing protein [Lachnospiraceae bacterium]|nr:DUF234 domain-containing protein [Lachnospiraceae bacterium]
MGLSETVSDFVRDKECFYYKAASVTDIVQRQLFASELFDQTGTPHFPDANFENLITSYISSRSDRKKLIIFEDFQHLIKENPTLINFFANLVFERSKSDTVMLLLVSDDIRWVENDMVRLMGRKTYEISGVIKLNEFTPIEFRQNFPDMPLNEIMTIYSFVGGKSTYYDRIKEGMTGRDLIISWLEMWEDEDLDPNRYLGRDIREPVLYNTILCNLARGAVKLNDIYKSTGIERAKLSVYIKTLSERGITEKIKSAEAGDSKYTLKGSYRIKDVTVRFYYRFVFPHRSSLSVLGAERFYRKYVEDGIGSVISEQYHLFCMEHIRWLERENRLNFKVASIDEYFDRGRAIDFIITAAGGNVIACACQYGQYMSYKRYEEVRSAVKKNKLPCENIWLFSSSGFDQKLSLFGSVTPGIKLIEGVASDISG